MKFCSDCNQDHSHQRVDYPMGSTVIVVGEFGGNPAGTLGEVTGHCDDGRAVVTLHVKRRHGEPFSHTFHFPDGYVAVAAGCRQHQLG